MSATEALAEGVQLLDELLYEDVLAPDPTRSGWSELEGRVRLVGRAVRERLLDPLPGALEAAGEHRGAVAARVAGLLGEAAALLFASGDRLEADRLLARAAEVSPAGPLQEELRAGRRDPMAFCRLNHARWLYAHGRGSQARPVLRTLAKETQEEVLRRAAREAGQGPRPVTSAPPLFRLNGFGVGLYGSSDARADGSHVTWYCLSALWIPILPLTAYRVRRVDSNRYQFLSRERLGSIARAWQLALLAAAVGWGGYVAVRGYLDSPTRQARLGIEEAQRLEQGGRGAEAMTRYLATATRFAGQADVKPAGAGVLRIAAASVKEPCRPEDVPVVGRVVAAFDRLPVAARSGEPAGYLLRRLLTWTDQLGTADRAHVHAALAVLDMSARVAQGADAAKLGARRNALRRTLADALAAADRPVDALGHYLVLDDPAALQSAQVVIATFGEGPSLWQEAAPEVKRWIERAAKAPDRAEAATRFQARLDGAAKAAAASAAVVESGDEARIAAALARAPRDQELAAGLAGLRRDRGDAAGCLRAIEALGPAGRLTGNAQQLLGACAAETGDLARADGILSEYLDERLSPFVRARREYDAAGAKLEQELWNKAERGAIPADLTKALKTAPKPQQEELYHKWVSESLTKDPRLAELRGEYLRHRAVVGASLTLGSVKLRRAAETHGDERRAHLEAAERAFLSIREEAAGTPSFHLELGQVWYRLGKVSEGQKELQALLDRKEPQLSMAVANCYRELGIEARSREILEAVYTSADTAIKQQAAFTRAHVSIDLEDQELWLRRSDPSSAAVRIFLLETQAYRLLGDGKDAEADRAFAKAAASYAERAAHDSSSANNTAMALLGRYSATGEIVHVRSAVTRLEAATRLEPDSAILLGHLAGTLDDLSRLAVLERWVRVRELRPHGGESQTLVQSIAMGPLYDELIRAFRKEPSFQRQTDVTRQEQILAPQKPGPYVRQLRWLRRSMDTAGLLALTRWVDQVRVDQGDPEERKLWLSGAKDASRRDEARKEVRRSEQRLERIQKLKHPQTTAAAHLLHGDSLDTLAFYDPTAEAYVAVAEAYRRAGAAWPEIGAEYGLTNALMKVAAWRAAESSPALKQALKQDLRTFRVSMALQRALAGPAAAEVAAALHRQPELQEAARLRRGIAERQPSLTDWLIARVAGDPALERAASRAFAREDLALVLALDVKLNPDDEEDQADLALFNAHRPGGS